MIKSGQVFELPHGHGELCEDCDDAVPAVYKVAGEIDSFGIKWVLWCETHLHYSDVDPEEDDEEYGHGACRDYAENVGPDND